MLRKEFTISLSIAKSNLALCGPLIFTRVVCNVLNRSRQLWLWGLDA
jgi:hypothetical protein